MANMTALDDVMAWITAHPERHNQGTWYNVDLPGRPSSMWTAEEDWQCHTTACLAGWAAIRDGWRPMLTDGMAKGDEIRSVRAIAAELLDLNEAQEYALFIDAGNLDELRAVTEAIRRGVTDGGHLYEIVEQVRDAT